MASFRTRNRLGQAAVEIALIMPLLLVLLLGIVEFGEAWNVKQVVTEAAREGARRAVVPDGSIDQDSVDATIIGALGLAGIPSSAATVQFDRTPPPSGHWRDEGTMQTVDVRVQYRFRFFGPILEAIFGDDAITITSVVKMRNEPEPLE